MCFTPSPFHSVFILSISTFSFPYMLNTLFYTDVPCVGRCIHAYKVLSGDQKDMPSSIAAYLTDWLTLFVQGLPELLRFACFDFYGFWVGQDLVASKYCIHGDLQISVSDVLAMLYSMFSLFSSWLMFNSSLRYYLDMYMFLASV